MLITIVLDSAFIKMTTFNDFSLKFDSSNFIWTLLMFIILILINIHNVFFFCRMMFRIEIKEENYICTKFFIKRKIRYRKLVNNKGGATYRIIIIKTYVDNGFNNILIFEKHSEEYEKFKRYVLKKIPRCKINKR